MSLSLVKEPAVTDLFARLANKPFFTSWGPVSPAAISAAESTLGLTFAEDYREYVGVCGVASFDGHELTGICPFPRLDVVEVTQEERRFNPGIPNGLYVVEQAHIDGIVAWQSASGEVYRTSPGTGPFKLCDSLSEYINL